VLDTEGRNADHKLAAAEGVLRAIFDTMDDFESFTAQDRRVTPSYLRDCALLLLVGYAGCLTRSELESLYLDNVFFSGSGLRMRVQRLGRDDRSRQAGLGRPRRTAMSASPRRRPDVLPGDRAAPLAQDPSASPSRAAGTFDSCSRRRFRYLFNGHK
jgi:site-specific recombinase XerD